MMNPWTRKAIAMGFDFELRYYLTFEAPGMRLRFFVIVFLTVSCAAFSESKADFDEICEIFAEAAGLRATHKELNAYISENVKKRILDEDAVKAYVLSFHIEPGQRYSVFKEMAEASTGESWECVAMREILALPGR